jgi:8-amino-7-oxononanoate synthase
MTRAAAAINTAIESRKKQQRFRSLRSVAPLTGAEIALDGKAMLNFSSNDYLGLSQHAFLKEKAIEYTSRYGVGAGSSRLVSGNNEIYEKLERELAKLKETQTALIFSTGFQLNLTVMMALSKTADLFLCDKLSHSSLLLGASLSKLKAIRFKHNDFVDLEQRFNQHATPDDTTWIISESVFSMDGDLCPMDELNSFANDKENCHLFIDEAHATGVFGKNGMGIASLNEHSIAMGTFGKGLGSFGAYIACSKELRDYLINFCPGLIYTTALPPAVLGAIEAALQIVPSMDRERAHLLSLADYMRLGLASQGFDIGASKSQIIPVIVKDDEKALSLAQHLEAAGIFAPAIRPPTVPVGAARIRLSLSALHTQEHVDYFLKVLKQWSRS